MSAGARTHGSALELLTRCDFNADAEALVLRLVTQVEELSRQATGLDSRVQKLEDDVIIRDFAAENGGVKGGRAFGSMAANVFEDPSEYGGKEDHRSDGTGAEAEAGAEAPDVAIEEADAADEPAEAVASPVVASQGRRSSLRDSVSDIAIFRAAASLAPDSSGTGPPGQSPRHREGSPPRKDDTKFLAHRMAEVRTELARLTESSDGQPSSSTASECSDISEPECGGERRVTLRNSVTDISVFRAAVVAPPSSDAIMKGAEPADGGHVKAVQAQAPSVAVPRASAAWPEEGTDTEEDETGESDKSGESECWWEASQSADQTREAHDRLYGQDHDGLKDLEERMDVMAKQVELQNTAVAALVRAQVEEEVLQESVETQALRRDMEGALESLQQQLQKLSSNLTASFEELSQRMEHSCRAPPVGDDPLPAASRPSVEDCLAVVGEVAY